ncbi:hypothetical protein SUGI_0279630 [Cryptomeria japonica]|nr:hypothetical protein SUGI_0279630 [Cryptomeria japonica]
MVRRTHIASIGYLQIPTCKRLEIWHGSGSGGCASLLFSSWCGSSSSGIRKDGTPSLKVDAVHPSSNGDKDGSPMEPPATPFPVPLAGNRENDAGVVLKVCMKSSLKKPCGCAAGMENTAPNAHGIDCKRRRKVQWIDANGQDLAQIKEFEQSDSSGSDDEEDEGGNHGLPIYFAIWAALWFCKPGQSYWLVYFHSLKCLMLAGLDNCAISDERA